MLPKRRHCDVRHWALRLAPIQDRQCGWQWPRVTQGWSKTKMQAKRSIKHAVALAAGLALLGGCTAIKDHRGYLVDQMLLDSIQPGVDNQLSVERTLGRPSFTSQFGEPTWYYVSINTKQAAFTRPRADDQLVLKVKFDARGNVTGIERTGIEKVVRLNPDGDKTPTLGRERTFLEDLFGNIGTVGAPGAPQGGGGN
jgi:outer membrane protein assembly factor BamE (lipoprotein component of BamABCDE complex)